MLIGCHIPFSKKEIGKTFDFAQYINATSFAFFSKHNLSYTNVKYTSKQINEFKNRAFIEYGKNYKKNIIIHAGYIINLCSNKKDIRDKSYKSLLNEVEICESLGLQYLVIHPGSPGNSQIANHISIIQIAECINNIHNQSNSCIILLENMSSDKQIGYYFEDLNEIISLITDKKRIGVCLDTCHLYVSGYDISTVNKCKDVLKMFDKIVGFKYLKAWHFNNSKYSLNSMHDSHLPILNGRINKNIFKFLINHDATLNKPIILETHDTLDGFKEEIRILRNYKK